MTPRLVDATGSRRRLEAMAALGHTARTIGAHMDNPPAPASVRSLVSSWRHPARRWIDANTAADLTRAYNRLRHIPGTNSVVRIHARRDGCLPPEAWDGVDIDSPDAQPDDDEERAVA